jgi:DNA-binding MarR family transcriptional regulator
MSQRHRFQGRSFTKLDRYALGDVRREFGLSFTCVSFLQVLCEHADWRNQELSTDVMDLHDYTGQARSTINRQLKELIEKGLVIELPKLKGCRARRYGLTPVYERFVVPPDTANLKGNRDTQMQSERSSGEDEMSNLLRATCTNTGFGGSEAIEEVGVQDSQSEPFNLRTLYRKASESWPTIQGHLEEAILQQGLRLDGDWWLEAERTGIGEELKGVLEGVIASFENF